MKATIEETNRRRTIQKQYNDDHGIVPATIVKGVRDLTERLRAHAVAEERAAYQALPPAQLPKAELAKLIKELEKQMKESAQALEFERAALLRDQIIELREALADKEDAPAWERAKHLTEELE
jgi:excinuclease ABC subunit B